MRAGRKSGYGINASWIVAPGRLPSEICSVLDRPALDVTPEMCAAGGAVLDELSGVISSEGLAEAVYIAMARTAICDTLSTSPFALKDAPSELDTQNGSVQLSARVGDSTIGLLVESRGLFLGTLLSPAEAQELASRLLACGRLSQAVDR